MKTIEINDKSSFLKFLNEFRKEFSENGDTWENNNLSSFLEAIQGWVEDMDGYYANMEDDIDLVKPGWKVFADILRGAAIYE